MTFVKKNLEGLERVQMEQEAILENRETPMAVVKYNQTR
jgi:hypothetical protein